MSDLAASTQLAPAAPRAAAASAKPLAALDPVLRGVRSFTAQPAVAKSMPALGLVALLGLAAIIWMAFSAPPARTLFSGLADEEKAAVVDALRAAGVSHQIDRTTGAVSVSETDYHQARMLLAAQGLPKSGPDGNEVMNSLPLGASRAVETERLRSAREVDLARTIEGIDVVQSARVHLAVQPPSVFLRDRVAPAASVMLTLVNGRTLGDGQVQAIVHLVASSVPGLSPDGVSVVDQNGRLLSRDGSGLSGASDRQVAMQSAVEERYRRALSSLLTPILGAGNFTAEVHADLDFSEVQATREGFPQEASTLRTEEGSVTADGGASAADRPAAGIPGALANEAPPAAQVAAAPDGTLTPETPGAPAAQAGGRRTENYVRNFAVGREVSVTRRQPGEVKRLSVAVAIKTPEGGQAPSVAELKALEDLVKGAIGFSQGRGDTVAISARAFAPAEAAPESWWEASWIAPLARNLTALALAALLVFGVGRPLLKRLGAAASQRSEAAKARKPAVGDEIAAALVDQAKSDPSARVTLEMIEAAQDYEARAALIRNFVRQDPPRAALVVRDLIRADARNGVER
ncbi:MAG: flagellar basal-body MS-ring/collar protein FliF [Allosphingosinicella sp.]|uniref:flagellar basal-body MS-ring/collar protein FliF n=1 Tax=Allosphingosinicella sp. TaxID=2823234 RepID=UPI00392C36A9